MLPRPLSVRNPAGLLRFGTAAVLLALTACGDAEPGERRLAATVDTVNGLERFLYAEASAPRLDWTADTVAVLGDAFAEEAYQFNEVSAEGLAADPDGNLLVLDRQGKRVLRYSPDGRHLGTFGREGEGPGELNQPLGMDVGPGDTVWVSDFSNTRLTGYPLAGGEPRVLGFPENSGFPSLRLAAVEGAHILQFRPLFNFRRGSGGGFRMSRGDGTTEEQVMLPLVRYDPATFEPRDTLWSVPEPPTDMVQLELGDRLMVTMMAREFHPEFLWEAFSDGGLVISDTAAYVLRLLDRDGTVRRLIERDPAPRRTTEADREAVRQRLRDEADEGIGIRMGGGGPDDETRRRMLEQRLEKMTFAEVIPRIIELRVDPQDRIWVGVSEEVADRLDRIDIYDRQGALLGELRDIPMPDVFLDASRIGVLRRDELDVQQVVVVEIGGAEGEAVAMGSAPGARR